MLIKKQAIIGCLFLQCCLHQVGASTNILVETCHNEDTLSILDIEQGKVYINPEKLLRHNGNFYLILKNNELAYIRDVNTDYLGFYIPYNLQDSREINWRICPMGHIGMRNPCDQCGRPTKPID